MIGAALVSCDKSANVPDPAPVPATHGTLKIGVRGLKDASSRAGTKVGNVAGEGLSVTMGGSSSLFTRAGALANDDIINDIWMLQFVPQYDNDVATLAIVKAQYQNSIPAPKTYASGETYYNIEYDYLSQESVAFFIANTGDASLFSEGMVLNMTEFYQKLLFSFDSESSVVSGNGIVMASEDSYAVYDDGSVDADEIWLERIAVKLEFTLDLSELTLPPGDQLNIATVQVKNVPKMGMALNVTYPSAEGYSVFPPVGGIVPSEGIPDFSDLYTYTSASELFMSYDPAAYVPVDDAQTFVWYIPSNLRGTNTYILSQQYKYWANDPSYLGTQNTDDEGSYSTCIEISGTYTYSSSGETEPVTITIYPGSSYNSVPDYQSFNLYRNTWYNLNATIRYIESGIDPRVDLPSPI